MNPRTPPTTPSLRKSAPFGSMARWQPPAMVDEDAVTLRLRPLRWRDRMLPEVIRWAGATACLAAVTGGWLLGATPSVAARMDEHAPKAPVAAARTLDSTPVLAAVRIDPDAWAEPMAMPIEEEDEVIILDEDEDEVLIFDDALDGPASAAMADLHLERGQPGLALQYSLQAVGAEPMNAIYQQQLGDAYALAGDDKTARRAFRRARRLRRR